MCRESAKRKVVASIGGMLDGVYLDYSKVIALEKMPTKLELIRDVAIMIKKVYHLP